MATLNIPRYKAHGQLDAGYKGLVRVLDFVLDLSKDVTMTTATDVINLARLPEGAVVMASSVQQVVAGTGTGTLAARVGTVATSAALLATAAAGTVAATDPAVTPTIVPAGGADLNLIGATAARTTGTIRVIVVLVEGDRNPRTPTIVSRDQLA